MLKFFHFQIIYIYFNIKFYKFLKNCAGFVLRKWMSNDKELINDVQYNSGGVRAMGDNGSTKILGLNWNSDNDVLLICYTPCAK